MARRIREKRARRRGREEGLRELREDIAARTGDIN